MKMFNAFIRANLYYYCPLVWVNTNGTYHVRLENVYERALRLVYNDKDCSYYDLLLRANIPSVQIRWQRVLATEVFKALHGISPPYIQDLFRVKDTPYSLRENRIVINTWIKFSHI